MKLPFSSVNAVKQWQFQMIHSNIVAIQRCLPGFVGN